MFRNTIKEFKGKANMPSSGAVVTFTFDLVWDGDHFDLTKPEGVKVSARTFREKKLSTFNPRHQRELRGTLLSSIPRIVAETPVQDDEMNWERDKNLPTDFS